MTAAEPPGTGAGSGGMDPAGPGQAIQGAASGRLDTWLFSVRLFPSRSAATQACRSGRVRVGAIRSKAAARIKPGDRITFSLNGRDRDVIVVRIITRRVGAPVALTCYEDHSPPPPPRQVPAGQRDRGAGRPTKRDRRLLDQLRGRGQ